MAEGPALTFSQIAAPFSLSPFNSAAAAPVYYKSSSIIGQIDLHSSKSVRASCASLLLICCLLSPSHATVDGRGTYIETFYSQTRSGLLTQFEVEESIGGTGYSQLAVVSGLDTSG